MSQRRLSRRIRGTLGLINALIQCSITEGWNKVDDEGVDLVGLVEPGVNANLPHGLPIYPAPPGVDAVTFDIDVFPFAARGLRHAAP